VAAAAEADAAKTVGRLVPLVEARRQEIAQPVHIEEKCVSKGALWLGRATHPAAPR